MWVAPDVRGRGIGEHLIDTIVAWVCANGIHTLEASVSENNPARWFYQKLGFVETGETEPLRSNPSVNILMIRRDISPKNRG